MKKLILSTLLLLFFTSPGFAQVSAINGFHEEQYRLHQLLGDSLDHNYSLNNRGIWYENQQTATPGSQNGYSIWQLAPARPEYDLNEHMRLGIYHPSQKVTYNSNIPVGENNGAAWYGSGITTEWKGGFYLTSDYVTLTFKPHISYQQNQSFKVPRFVPRDENDNVLYGADELEFQIDNPFRFGPDPYWTTDLGQTSLRVHYKNLEAGFSNESMWWGPGVRYALVMSNNAPGFKHVFLGSKAPIPLPLNIGNIEFKWIWGDLDDSDYFDPAPDQFQRDRYITALNFNYSPSFAPNLHLGFTRVFHKYVPDGGLKGRDFFLVFETVQKFKLNERIGTNKDEKNQLLSVYGRWVFPESHAEIYGEYYREDHNFDFRDFLMEPNHDRAYTIGFQKLIMSDSFINYLKVNGEINQLNPSRLDEIRAQAYYYTHSRVKQGHTNRGQILGAAIGPGSNSQFLGVNGYFDKGMLGLFLQRWVDNDLFHLEINDRRNTNDIFRHRVNVNIGTEYLYKFRDFMFSGKIMWTKAYNYGRFGLTQTKGVNFNTFEPNDEINWQLSLGITYLFGNQ